MVVSDEDRRRFMRQAEALQEAETDEEVTGAARERETALRNESRARRGLPPLKDEFEDPPEAQFHERARALGLIRRRG